MSKFQVPTVGGIRKVIKPGDPSSALTTITAVLQQLIDAVASLQAPVNTGGGNIGTGNEATIVLGPGLSGGGTLVGNVPINLVQPPALIAEDGIDGDPGLQGIQGPRGLQGIQGVPGFFGEDGADGDWVPWGATGLTGLTGAVGAIGATGQSAAIPEDVWFEELPPHVTPTSFGNAVFNGPVLINGSAITTPVPFMIQCGVANQTGFRLNGFDVAVMQFNAAASTNKVNIAFLQNNVTVARFGADGTQAILTDSVNGDFCITNNNGGSIRFSSLPSTTTSVSQIIIKAGGALGAVASPLTSAATQAFTGVANFKSTATVSTAASLVADAALTVTCNETGRYDLDIFLSFFETTLGTGGIQFDVGGGGATLGDFKIGVIGFVGGAVAAKAGVTSSATAFSFATITTSSTAQDWVHGKGTFNVTTTGTVAVRWGQASLLAADATNLTTGSSIILTKIG